MGEGKCAALEGEGVESIRVSANGFVEDEGGGAPRHEDRYIVIICSVAISDQERSMCVQGVGTLL